MDRETLYSRLKDKKGSVTITVAVLFFVFIAFAAFAVDVGYMLVRRNELQNIADTAALAATSELGSRYDTMSYTEGLTYMPDPAPFLAKAQEVASATGVSGVTIAPGDFRLGVWNPSTHTFTPQATRPTAVNVTARKDNVANGPFSTFLAGVLGIGSFNVSTIATASLTPPLAVFEGESPVPVGISLAWFDPEKWEREEKSFCDQPIRLYPTGDLTGCAGWHVYDQTPSSAHILKQTIDGLIDGSYTNPPIYTGQTQFDFTGGNVADALRNMTDLFDSKKGWDAGANQACSDRYPGKYVSPSNTWTVCVPVYGPNDWSGDYSQTNCDNPHATMTIYAIASVTICYVTSPPDPQEIGALVRCDGFCSGPGGGPLDFGTMGTRPNLVQ